MVRQGWEDWAWCPDSGHARPTALSVPKPAPHPALSPTEQAPKPLDTSSTRGVPQAPSYNPPRGPLPPRPSPLTLSGPSAGTGASRGAHGGAGGGTRGRGRLAALGSGPSPGARPSWRGRTRRTSLACGTGAGEVSPLTLGLPPRGNSRKAVTSLKARRPPQGMGSNSRGLPGRRKRWQN